MTPIPAVAAAKVRLAAGGTRVRAAARSTAPLERECWTDVERVAADVLQPESLRAAMRGIGTVYFLVHLMGYGRDLRELERIAARNVAQAAADCGRAAWLVDFRGAAVDHPVLLTLPESAYLKCAFVRVE